MKHAHRWIAALVEALESEVDEEVMEKILIGCGRSCISKSFVDKARRISKESSNLNEFLESLGEEWSHLKLENDEVYVEYERCFCPFVKNYPGTMSSTWCNCSRGWTKELFETVLEKPVKVEMMSTIRQGSDICRFKVKLSRKDEIVPSYVLFEESSG
ncbi:MAG: DUF6144 family protein [Candidatus Bathyarchaeota archaeon]